MKHRRDYLRAEPWACSQFAIPEEPVSRIGPDECVAMQESAMQEIKALAADLEHIKSVHLQYKKAYKRLQVSFNTYLPTCACSLARGRSTSTGSA